jgi:hypothetical protein
MHIFVKIHRNQLYTKTWFMLFDCDNNIVLLYAISLFCDHQNKKKMTYLYIFYCLHICLTFFVSLKQRIWDVSKFGFGKISLNVIQITNIKWLNDCKFCTICF